MAISSQAPDIQGERQSGQDVRTQNEQQNSYLKFSNVDFPQDVAAGLSAERISLPPLWSREAAMWRRTNASKDLEIASCLMGTF
ncbi:hypothetical protein SLEP1_g23924 [Rubroshorea leprosula]|uniref:Uncharacterized protein n=1 Tax=Rubroshorea leprosula TaxID=152421 RepID=A0AAV5JE67_9ROSI|nr:hypothetical protein SLEP1_g23924 [Rubroshorea leprosula]